MRKRTRRAFTRRVKGPQPRFQVGDSCGEFTVIEYIGYSAVRPDEVKLLKQAHHWYKVRCACTNATEEVHSQQQLIDIRRVRACDSCTTELAKLKE